MATDEEGFLLEAPIVPEDEDFCFYGTVYAYPEHADALEAVYAELTRLAPSEKPGMVYYCLGRDPDDPTIFHFFERYTGRQAFEDHKSQPIAQELFKNKYIRGVKAKVVKPIQAAAKKD